MFEIVETAGEWIVRRGGLEVARYEAEAAAMRAVAERMLEEGGDEPVSFSIRYRGRGS